MLRLWNSALPLMSKVEEEVPPMVIFNVPRSVNHIVSCSRMNMVGWPGTITPSTRRFLVLGSWTRLLDKRQSVCETSAPESLVSDHDVYRSTASQRRLRFVKYPNNEGKEVGFS